MENCPGNDGAGRRTRVGIAAAVLAVLAAVPAAYGFETRRVLGNWETDFGEISIHQADDTTFVGSYSYQGTPARLYGTRTADGIYEGFWVQEVSEVTCGETVRGSRTWGRFRFAFQGNSFVGLWNYCARRLVNQKNYRWRGTLLNRGGG